jgi:hypothetical protein
VDGLAKADLFGTRFGGDAWRYPSGGHRHWQQDGQKRFKLCSTMKSRLSLRRALHLPARDAIATSRHFAATRQCGRFLIEVQIGSDFYQCTAC